MFDVVFIALFISHLTPEQQFDFVNQYVEQNTEYKYFYHVQDTKVFQRTMIGDCSDKALLKCTILRKNKIPCGEVYGYSYNEYGEPQLHAWIKVKINGTWVSSEPNLLPIGSGIS